MLSQEQLERRMQRAAAALGPGRSVADRVRRRIEAVPTGHRPPARRKGMFTMNRIAKLSAAAAVIAALAVTLIWVGGDGSGVAWAEVRDRVRNARTFSFLAVQCQEGREATAIKFMMMQPGLVRMEVESDGGKTVRILDASHKKMLILDERAETAVLMDLSSMSKQVARDMQVTTMLAKLKELTDKPDERLGDKQIDGRAVTGFRTRHPAQILDVWVDARTGDLVQIDGVSADAKLTWTATDFRVDERLEEGLFSLEPPAGYANETEKFTAALERQRELARRAMSAANLDWLAKACRRYRKANEGKWPDSLRDLTEYGIKPEDLVNPRQPQRKAGYVYVKPAAGAAPNQIVIYEAHDEWGEGANVACVDGHVEFIRDEATFKKRLPEAPEDDDEPAEKPDAQEGDEEID